MSKVATDALTKLFKQGDKVTAGSRSVSLLLNGNRFPAYHNIKDVNVKMDVHASLENAKRFGAISIDWVKGYHGTDIERVQLVDLNLLANFLDVKTLSKRIDNALATITTNKTIEPGWLNEIYEGVYQGWREGKKPYGFAPEDASLMLSLVTLVSRIDDGTNDLDMRTLSARLFRQSKFIENKLLNKLVSIYRDHLNKPAATTEEILAEISLSKYPWPVLVSGSINLISNEGDKLYCGVKPFIGVPPDSIKDFEIKGDISYILSIENFSSFNTYTRKIHDGGLVIYTNGFPSKWLANFYKQLLSKLGSSVPIYHWGDVDVGGFRILGKMQEYASGLVVCPHQMNPSEVCGGEFSKSELNDLMKITGINKLTDGFIRDICESKQGKLEQEYVNPVSPLN